jgi:hypothetical protein
MLGHAVPLVAKAVRAEQLVADEPRSAIIGKKYSAQLLIKIMWHRFNRATAKCDSCSLTLFEFEDDGLVAAELDVSGRVLSTYRAL